MRTTIAICMLSALSAAGGAWVYVERAWREQARAVERELQVQSEARAGAVRETETARDKTALRLSQVSEELADLRFRATEDARLSARKMEELRSENARLAARHAALEEGLAHSETALGEQRRQLVQSERERLAREVEQEAARRGLETALALQRRETEKANLSVEAAQVEAQAIGKDLKTASQELQRTQVLNSQLDASLRRTLGERDAAALAQALQIQETRAAQLAAVANAEGLWQARAAVAALHAKLETALKEKGQALLTAQRSAAELQRAQTELARVQRQSGALQQSLAQKDAQLAQLQQQLAALQVQVAQLRGEAAGKTTLSKEMQQLQAQISARDETIRSLTQQVARLQAEPAKAKADAKSSLPSALDAPRPAPPLGAPLNTRPGQAVIR